MEEFREWMNKAEKDLKTAKYILKGNIFDATVFHAQQSVEKAFKALLLKNTKKFPRIHDLTKFAKLVEAPEKIIVFCSVINPGYILSRYPNVGDDYTKEDSEDIIKSAEEVLKWIRKNL